MLTQKLDSKTTKQVYGFLHWPENGHIEQREIQSFISLGRDKDNMVVFDDDFVSRRHCRIQRQDKAGFVLLDMNSSNGTFLNGNRIFKALLKNNDRIQIGKKELIFSFERAEHHWNIHTQSRNPAWKQQLDNLPNLAKSQLPVLITGPSGTGKEMLAKLIHHHSPRSQGPMVSVNCSALSESLIESEFFGHIKGSYTGALTHRKGAFVAASGGSLFLDEIGDLPLPLQPKLLRAIEYQEIKAVGSDRTMKTDVRIIAATHQNLQKKIEDNTFRSDLYFRLHVLTVSPPALKDRMEDFANLLKFFCAEYNTGFSQKAIQMLRRHHWPGNIRELKNTIARARVIYPGRQIQTEDLNQLITTPPRPSMSPSPPSEPRNTRVNISIDNQENKSLSVMETLERDVIVEYLKMYKGNQTKLSQKLGIPTSTLYNRLRRYNLEPDDFKKPENP